MRRVTRNLILGILAVLVLLLALGALPGLLKSGDPYYVTATPIAENGTDGNRTATDAGNHTAIDASTLSERAYPYTWEALRDANATSAGQSEPYWKGYVGLKEAFTHSPFDERDALRAQYPNATTDEGAFVARNGTLYRVAVTQ